jgi:hypothetical protein
MALSAKSVAYNQGDQIGQFFADWANRDFLLEVPKNG